MPVVRTSENYLCEGNRPDWCKVTSAGVFRVSTSGGRFDLHHYDFHEYWLISRGKAKVRSEGVEYYVKAGDIVCTHAGEEHDFVEVYEDIEAFWFEDPCPENGRTGHLHRTAEAAKGHAVPCLSVPEDFPA